MDIRKIKKLIELLEETGISEIEIKEGEESLRLSRHSYSEPHSPKVIVQPQAQTQPSTAAPVPVDEKQHVEAQESPGYTICSPMVGTFYTSSSPDNPAFVTVGKTVKIGDTLCIIEAMKMFNEIESDRAGVITAILGVNGEPVEYDQPLFIIE